jgi:hypothetical protein
VKNNKKVKTNIRSNFEKIKNSERQKKTKNGQNKQQKQL